MKKDDVISYFGSVGNVAKALGILSICIRLGRLSQKAEHLKSKH
jgi:hypothetical protein